MISTSKHGFGKFGLGYDILGKKGHNKNTFKMKPILFDHTCKSRHSSAKFRFIRTLKANRKGSKRSWVQNERIQFLLQM